MATPDLKKASGSRLLLVDLSSGHARLGGSALGQVYSQLGDATPDCDLQLLKRAFEATQVMLRADELLSVHDRSDGGLITTALEMAFAGNVGLTLDVPQVGAEAGTCRGASLG